MIPGLGHRMKQFLKFSYDSSGNNKSRIILTSFEFFNNFVVKLFVKAWCGLSKDLQIITKDNTSQMWNYTRDPNIDISQYGKREWLLVKECIVGLDFILYRNCKYCF